MKQCRNYEDYLIESLKDQNEASAYLKAALEDALETNDLGIFQLAMRDVIEAQGGVSEISSKMHVGRESLYKSLYKNGKPRFSTIMNAIDACGFELEFHPRCA